MDYKVASRRSENVQYLRMSLKKEKEDQKENSKEESQEEKEVNSSPRSRKV
ncbi:MAG: hypothetical protein ACYS3N_15035 [Planctomycetota bacterium]